MCDVDARACGQAEPVVERLLEWPPLPLSGAGGEALLGMLAAPLPELGYDVPELPNVRLLSVLGQGASAMVYEGELARAGGLRVAVKVFRDGADRHLDTELRALRATAATPGLSKLVERRGTALYTTPVGRVRSALAQRCACPTQSGARMHVHTNVSVFVYERFHVYASVRAAVCVHCGPH